MTMLQALAKSGILALGISITAVVVLLVVLGTTLWVQHARKEERAEESAEEHAEERAEEHTEECAALREKAAEPQEPTVATEETEEKVVADEVVATEKEQTAQPYPAFIRSLVAQLPPSESAVFERIVLQNEEDLNGRVKIPVSQYEREGDFLADFFRSCGKYAKRLPIAVTENLYERQKPYADTERKQTSLRRKMIGAYYVRRKEEDTLPRCEALCKEDVTYHLQTVGTENASLPPLKRLIILCVAQGRYDEALSYCDTAIAHHIIDRKGAGYEERKREKAQERERKAALKAQKK